MNVRVRGLAVGSLVVLVALVAWPPAPTSAAAAAQISYMAIATPTFESLCVGQTVEYSVSISRTTIAGGRSYSAWVSGGSVVGTVADQSIATLEPDDVASPVAGPQAPWATLVARGRGPGQTTISVEILRTGEEQRVGKNHPTHAATVTIEVADCWKAYTSGLGTTFTEDEMGDLSEPFFLAGVTPNVAGIESESQFMFFAPSPRDRLQGSYAFIDTAWAALGPSGRCTAFISGQYDVVFYHNAQAPKEGDLLMKGTGVYVCPGFALPIDYSNHTGFQIGMLPKDPAP